MEHKSEQTSSDIHSHPYLLDMWSHPPIAPDLSNLQTKAHRPKVTPTLTSPISLLVSTSPYPLPHNHSDMFIPTCCTPAMTESEESFQSAHQNDDHSSLGLSSKPGQLLDDTSEESTTSGTGTTTLTMARPNQTDSKWNLTTFVTMETLCGIAKHLVFDKAASPPGIKAPVSTRGAL